MVPTSAFRGRLPAVLFGLTVAAEVAACVLSWSLESRYDTVLYALSNATFAAAGALIVFRHPRHLVGWLFCATALQDALMADVAQGYGLRAAALGWPGGPVAEWVTTTSWAFGSLTGPSIFLFFPDGRLPGRRWRWVLWAGVLGAVLALPGWGLGHISDGEFASGRNPLATDAVPTDLLFAVGSALIIGALVASVAALGVRLRAARGVLRQQLKWYTYAAAVAGVFLPASLVLWNVWPGVRILPAVAMTALPVAACVAILRYRLYDIDVVINRTLVYGTITVLLAAAFAATVLTLGTVLGRGSPVATAGATLVVAVAFRPLRARVQAGVDRRFNRARYDALRRMADFLDALRADRAAPEQIRDVLRDLLDDPGLDLLFFQTESAAYVDADGEPVADADAAAAGRARLPISRRDEPVALVLHRPRPDPLPRDVVQAGGLAIEIARLRVELRRQLAEVRDSRARIVAAANEERRRIERDLHDGAQQRLVSIGLALRHAQHQLGAGAAGPEPVSRTLDGAVAQVGIAIDELRELARGLPPAQLGGGLTPAFTELARQSPVPVTVRVNLAPSAAATSASTAPPPTSVVPAATATIPAPTAAPVAGATMAAADGDATGRAAGARPAGAVRGGGPEGAGGGRLDRRVEVAAYFVGSEGVTNAVKHANAGRIELSAEVRDGRLVVAVADDGVGGATPAGGTGLRGLAERVAALGGTLRIASGPGTGTVLTAELPCGS
ncbi:histidine kinase [Pseudofrankia sp. BMG5.37]|uniref:sensor histidine kinase n=1 Tax=Pseudofrankia sp. BMG5.37 TaxID=3050035 RepID=UPI002894F598|nr:histidine kinase [Pseudofrankia sp. BMG5.37]MDT3444771.1 histidine kinase [Pseudofrankia sp. BMG5.37]